MFGQYAQFIIPAYAISAAVIGGLIGWTIVVHRNRRAELRRLEENGARRRSQQD